MRRVLLVGGAGIVLAILGAMPVQRFLDRSAPAPFTHRDPEPAPPLGDCRIGPLDHSRPRFWSVALDLDVQRAVIESRFLPQLSRTTGRPIGLPDTILLDDRLLPPPHHTDPWTMNHACRSLRALRRSTAASFRHMNRNPDDRAYRWLSLRVPVLYRRPPARDTEWPDFMRIDPDRVGILRLSRVGFSDEGTQALVAVGRYYAWGWSEGMYYLLERSGSIWRIVDEAIIWQV